MPKDDVIAALEKADGPSFTLEAELHRWRFPDASQFSIPNNYTASVDSAMLLLPQHTLWAVGRMEEGPFARICVPQPDGGYLGGYIEAKAQTAPIAICIAALRATERGEAGR